MPPTLADYLFAFGSTAGLVIIAVLAGYLFGRAEGARAERDRRRHLADGLVARKSSHINGRCIRL